MLETHLSYIKDIADTVLNEESNDINRDGAWPKATFDALKDAGVMGLTIPTQYSGLGGGLSSLSKAAYYLGFYSGSTGLCFSMHCSASAVIAEKPTPTHIDEYLTPICMGKHITTLAMSERGTGSHFYIPQLELETKTNNYELSGQKAFITNGKYADSYVLSVNAINSSFSNTFSCIMLNNTDDIQWDESWKGFGMRGNQSHAMELNNVKVPCDRLLGEIGDQSHYLFHIILPYFLASMSGTYLGIIKRAITEVEQYLLNRSYNHTQESLADIDILQHRLGKLWSRFQSLYHLTFQSATAFDSGEENAIQQVMAAKVEVAEQGTFIINECMTMVGGIGFTQPSIMSDLLRDIRAASVMSPTSDLLYQWIGRARLNLPIIK